MVDQTAVYERLAERLRNTPNGFMHSESGTDLKLLAKMFAPEEAALAAVMHLHREEVWDIAARAGVDEQAAHRILKGMARKGLVSVGRGKQGLAFGLLPFVVGSYEESLPYLDKEMAQLFEALVQESGGEGMLGPGPAIQRVIPVQESVSAEIDVLPYEGVSDLLDQAKSFGIRECICRKQKGLIGEPCSYPSHNCVSFAPVEGAFANLPYVQPVEKEEALRVLREAEEAGLVHTVYNQQEGIHYICNCCPCCCGIMRGIVEFGQAHALARSAFCAVVDGNACIACEACVERCHFGALSVPDDVCVVDLERCMGCGLCVSACPSDALTLERRAPEDQAPPPADHRQWQEQRAAARKVPLEELL
ncbi:MAG: 4Fe-4S dicluster domain-containing protein [Chloroflexi bacterium]|nr:4Fe-4S dicluster domain-containing protein [Chloroflexota bacterium]